MGDLRLRLWASTNPAARAFLFWARMPVATRDGDAFVLHDQRYMQPLARDRFMVRVRAPRPSTALDEMRSEEHTSELQSLMRISYAVFCLKKKKNTTTILHNK